jgi:DHA1 family bicyclomycin/chloramphenicol resistance-like MFS transporter
MMAVPIATFIGSFVKTTALPLFVGFLVCGVCGIILLMVLKQKSKQVINS